MADIGDRDAMLFTRCPDCETTFRITAEALRKAQGQVRCGRCACVFDAYKDLRQQRADAEQEDAESPAPISSAPRADSLRAEDVSALRSSAAGAFPRLQASGADEDDEHHKDDELDFVLDAAAPDVRDAESHAAHASLDGDADTHASLPADDDIEEGYVAFDADENVGTEAELEGEWLAAADSFIDSFALEEPETDGDEKGGGPEHAARRQPASPLMPAAARGSLSVAAARDAPASPPSLASAPPASAPPTSSALRAISSSTRTAAARPAAPTASAATTSSATPSTTTPSAARPSAAVPRSAAPSPSAPRPGTPSPAAPRAGTSSSAPRAGTSSSAPRAGTLSRAPPGAGTPSSSPSLRAEDASDNEEASDNDVLDEYSVAAVLEEIESGSLAAESEPDTEPPGREPARVVAFNTANAPRSGLRRAATRPLGGSETDEAEPPTASGSGATAGEVDVSLEWPAFAEDAGRPSRAWRYASLGALLLLAAQVTNHFRSDLASVDGIGPPLRDLYAKLGVDLIPRWKLSQYEIVDWVATAEPNAKGHGSLRITARIRNKGPRAQPFPYVHLQLKDRWEKLIASRMFRPGEYLPPAEPADELMQAGATARAEIEVVDPGPDAYGFELDVCMEQPNHALRCASDEVFR